MSKPAPPGVDTQPRASAYVNSDTPPVSETSSGGQHYDDFQKTHPPSARHGLWVFIDALTLTAALLHKSAIGRVDAVVYVMRAALRHLLKKQRGRNKDVRLCFFRSFLAGFFRCFASTVHRFRLLYLSSQTESRKKKE